MSKNSKNSCTISRRQAISSALLAGVALSTESCKTAGNSNPAISMPKAPPIIQDLLVNRQRARQIMQANKVDAIICSRPDNIYYLTNYYPQLAKMGMENTVYAILPIDVRQPPILVVGQFEFYLAGTEGVTSRYVDVHPFTMPAEQDLFHSKASLAEQLDLKGLPSFLPQTHSFHPLSASKTLKRDETLRLSGDMGATCETTLLKAVRDMPHPFKRVAIDSLEVSEIIRRAEIDVSFANGEQMLRQIRLQKSSAEMELMTYAARANAEAGLAAAKIVRNGASLQDLRREYYRQCVDRFMTPNFMVIDSMIPENAYGEISEGRSFLIDCVSFGQYYHGDYGRTVCVGEPTGAMKRATTAIAKVWDDLLPQLKPGLRYSEINAMATKIFKTTNSEATLICNPHSVGLRHTDEPSVEGSSGFVKDDLELVEGMVLSVDLPVIDTGLGGSGHLEDLVRIGKDGATLLNDGGDRIIIV